MTTDIEVPWAELLSKPLAYVHQTNPNPLIQLRIQRFIFPFLGSISREIEGMLADWWRLYPNLFLGISLLA